MIAPIGTAAAVTACEVAGRHAAMKADPELHRASVRRRYRWTCMDAIGGECSSCGSTILIPFELAGERP